MRWMIILICLTLSPLLYGQDRNFRHVTPAEGLNNGTINDIQQDDLGRLWLATWDGLMRYDGYEVENFKPIYGDSLSLPSKRVTRLSKDSKGNIWISTVKGLTLYNSEQNKFIRMSFEGRASDEAARYRVSDFNANLFINGPGGVYYYPNNDSTPGLFRSATIIGAEEQVAGRGVRFIFADKDRLLIAYRFRNPARRLISDIYSCRVINDSTIRRDNTPLLYVDGNIRDVRVKDGTYYIGTDEGLTIYDSKVQKTTKINEIGRVNISSLIIGSDDNIWFGTDLNGLFNYEPISGKVINFRNEPNRINTILGNSIFSLFEDFSGNLVIGHGGEGITILNLRGKQFETFRFDPQDPFSLGDNTVFSFAEFRNGMLIGTRNKGLYSMQADPLSGREIFREINIPESLREENEPPAIWWIEKESENTYWLGTRFGLILARYSGTNWRFNKYFGDATIRTVFIDDNRNMWFGGYSGLYIIPYSERDSMNPYQLSNAIESPNSISDKVITSFLLDRNDNFWIGTENGGINLLNRKYSALDFSNLNADQFIFSSFHPGSDENPLNTAEVNTIYEHTDGKIWIGTKGGGINVLNPQSRTIEYFTVKDGLPGNNVFGILPDRQGRLWLSTNKGLASYDPFSGSVNKYTPADGIQGNVFMANSYYKSDDGKMFFGGRNGFTLFNPEQIADNEVLPRFHFRGIKIQGKDIEIGDTIHKQLVLPSSLAGISEITLSYKDRNFDILFSAIHFQFPDENKVEYLLEGYNDISTIVDASSNQIRFTNVKNGTYLLKARAGNSDDIWQEDYHTLGITILPPWYRTKLSLIILFLIVFSVVIGLIRLLLNRQSLQHELSIEKIEKRNMKELNESKLRFFTNVSHEFRTPLSLTLGPIENLLRDKDKGDFKSRRQLELARRNAKVLLRLVDQIIDFRRLDAGKIKLTTSEHEVSSLLDPIVHNFEPLVKEKEVELYVNYPDDPVKLWIDPQKIEQVIYNILSNALKHVPNEGSIAISVGRVDKIPNNLSQDGKWVCISFYNDGKQIPEEDLYKVFERFYKVDNAQLGSGIGLAYSKSLVDLHKGFITAENTLSSGVTFNIYLPRGKSHLSEEEMTREDHYQSEDLVELDLPLKGITDSPPLTMDHDLSILVVEDNEELRDFFKSVLSEKFDFHEAENGLLGFEKAKEIVPDIIITDLLMPEMDGFELCKNVKEHNETSHIPVILLTAKNTPEDKISGYAAGADAYVLKPFEINVLEAQINRLIEDRKKIQEILREKGMELRAEEPSLTRENHFLNKVKSIIEEDIDDPELNVNGLAGKVNLSPTQLYRKIKALTGQTSVDFIKDLRLEKAAELLRTSPHSVKEICFMTGFKSPSYFVKCFKVRYEVTPKEYSLI